MSCQGVRASAKKPMLSACGHHSDIHPFAEFHYSSLEFQIAINQWVLAMYRVFACNGFEIQYAN